MTTTSYKHPNDYKTSEFLQLVLDSFNSPSRRSKFLCLEAYKLYGPDNPELGTIAQDRMSDLILDHGITPRGDFFPLSWSQEDRDSWYLNHNMCFEAHSLFLNICRVVFLQLAIEKYKRLGD